MNYLFEKFNVLLPKSLEVATAIPLLFDLSTAQ